MQSRATDEFYEGLCSGQLGRQPRPLPKGPAVNAKKHTTHPVHILGLPLPHPFPHVDTTLTPRQANRPLGQKRTYQIFIVKQTQQSLKTASCNQSMVFIASPARAGRRGREWARIRTRIWVPESFATWHIHGSLSRPPGHSVPLGLSPAHPLHLPRELGPPAGGEGPSPRRFPRIPT